MLLCRVALLITRPEKQFCTFDWNSCVGHGTSAWQVSNLLPPVVIKIKWSSRKEGGQCPPRIRLVTAFPVVAVSLSGIITIAVCAVLISLLSVVCILDDKQTLWCCCSSTLRLVQSTRYSYESGTRAAASQSPLRHFPLLKKWLWQMVVVDAFSLPLPVSWDTGQLV